MDNAISSILQTIQDFFVEIIPIIENASFLSFAEIALLFGIMISFFAALIALQKNRKLLNQEGEVSFDPLEGLGSLLENPKSILPHLEELKKRLINALIGFVLATIFAMLITNPILEVLAEPAGGLSTLQAIRVTEPFTIYFKVSLVLGGIISASYIIAQIWIFIAVGLKQSERRTLYILFPFAVLLFITGVIFSYKIMLPVAIPFLLNFMEIQAIPTLEDYISFILRALLWIGIAFEMPLIFFALAKFGIVNASMLLKNWRYATVGIVILASAITPTPDPINMLIVAAPLFILYFISIALTYFANRSPKE